MSSSHAVEESHGTTHQVAGLASASGRRADGQHDEGRCKPRCNSVGRIEIHHRNGACARRVLVRSWRAGVVPTPGARVLLKRANAIFDELRQGLEEIEFLSDPTAGELRIGTTEPMAAILSTAIERLSLRHPLMVFHVTVGDTRILLRDLRDRNLDLAITRMDGTAMERDIELETLFHDRLAVIAGQTNSADQAAQTDASRTD